MEHKRSVGVVWLFVLGVLAFAAVVTPLTHALNVPGIVAGDDSKPGAGGG
jgi:hypothetical protein